MNLGKVVGERPFDSIRYGFTAAPSTVDQNLRRGYAVLLIFCSPREKCRDLSVTIKSPRAANAAISFGALPKCEAREKYDQEGDIRKTTEFVLGPLFIKGERAPCYG